MCARPVAAVFADTPVVVRLYVKILPSSTALNVPVAVSADAGVVTAGTSFAAANVAAYFTTGRSAVPLSSLHAATSDATRRRGTTRFMDLLRWALRARGRRRSKSPSIE